jgi:hypothetical protein
MKKLMLTVVGLISLSQFSNISHSAEVLTNKTNDVSRKDIKQADILGSNEEL